VLELLQFEEKESRELVRIIALFYCFCGTEITYRLLFLIIGASFFLPKFRYIVFSERYFQVELMRKDR